jgi:hypothetical protein
MDVKGKVIQLLQLQSGMGKKGPWKKQEFILETQSQYPKKVCLSVWGDKVDQFNVRVGDLLTASVELESREYNGRWYTEARAWKIEKQSGGHSGSDTPPPSEEPFVADNSATDDLPF